jgi:hypothetical protein
MSINRVIRPPEKYNSGVDTTPGSFLKNHDFIFFLHNLFFGYQINFFGIVREF